MSDNPATEIKGFDVVESVTMSSVTRDGYLDKRSASGQQKPRYFRLKGDLYYFTTKENPTPKGVVLLQPFEKLPLVTPLASIGPHSFQVVFPAVTFLRAETEADAAAWANAFASSVAATHSQPSGNAPNSTEVDKGVVLYEGFLHKKSFAPEWKKYWFVLRPGVLEYYTSVQDTYAKGSLSLSRDLMTPTASICRYQTSTLRLHCAKSLTLTAESREEQEEWVTMVQGCIDQVAADKHAIKKNPIGWKRQGKLREVVTPLLDLLRDPFRLEYFRRFMKEFESEPYLYFWLDVQQYKRLCRKEDRTYLKPVAATMFTKYIKEGGEYALDLPKVIREETVAQLEEPSVNTFRDAQSHVYQILHDDYYALFLTSSHCSAMAKALFAL